MIKQALAILMSSLRSIPSRWGSTCVILIGIGGVVAVLIAILSLAHGFEEALQSTGSADRAIILRAGSTSEINGSMPVSQFNVMRDLPQIASTDDNKLAAMETFVTVNLARRNELGDGGVPMRGIQPASFAVRPEIDIVEGRAMAYGRYELIAGASAAQHYDGIEVGKTLRIRGLDWLVVGIFSASGGAYDAELWVDQTLLAASWNRAGTFSSMLVRLTDADSFEALQHLVENDKRLTAHALRESSFYADQSKNTTGMIQGIGVLVGVIMAFGAVFAALSSMYSALASRAAEIATLRALGFRPGALFIAILLEAAFISAAGAVIAGGLVYVMFHGTAVSTAAATSSTFTQIGFSFTVTPELFYLGIGLAVTLGLIGSILPTVGVLRAPIVQGLRRSG